MAKMEWMRYYSVFAATVVVALTIVTPHMRMLHVVMPDDQFNFVTANMNLAYFQEESNIIADDARSCNKTFFACEYRSTLSATCKATSGLMQIESPSGKQHHIDSLGDSELQAAGHKKYADYDGSNIGACVAVRAFNWFMPLAAAIGLLFLALEGHPKWLPETKGANNMCCSPLGWNAIALGCFLAVFLMAVTSVGIMTTKSSMNGFFTAAVNKRGHKGKALSVFHKEGPLALAATLLLSLTVIGTSAYNVAIATAERARRSNEDVKYALVSK